MNVEELEKGNKLLTSIERRKEELRCLGVMLKKENKDSVVQVGNGKSNPVGLSTENGQIILKLAQDMVAKELKSLEFDFDIL